MRDQFSARVTRSLQTVLHSRATRDSGATHSVQTVYTVVAASVTYDIIVAMNRNGAFFV